MTAEGKNGNGTTHSGERLLSEREVAERLAISEVTLQNWRATGKKGPAWLRLEGRTIRYRESDIATWLAAQEVQRPSPRPVGYPSGGLGQLVDRIRRSTPVEKALAHDDVHRHVDRVENEHVNGADHDDVHRHVDRVENEHVNGADHDDDDHLRPGR
jgi:predicted DNA-binding transcriptional regulator AlpA